jgi:ParB family chromosome partitioning protein
LVAASFQRLDKKMATNGGAVRPADPLDASRPGGQPKQEHVTLHCFNFIPGERQRALRPGLVADLAKSMAERGQIEPLVVTKNPGGGYDLIAGRHRLEAARKLKWETIRIEVRAPMSADEMVLCEIDENLVRGELDIIERGLHRKRAKDIYERLHPEATAKSIHARDARKTTAKRFGKVCDDTVPRERVVKPYTAAASEREGISPEVVRAEVRIGNIPNVEKAIGSSLSTSRNLYALGKLHKTNPAAVQDLIARAAAGEKVAAAEPSNAATEFAEWIAAKASPDEIPMVISWLQQVSAKGVTAALRRLQTEN